MANIQIQFQEIKVQDPVEDNKLFGPSRVKGVFTIVIGTNLNVLSEKFYISAGFIDGLTDDMIKELQRNCIRELVRRNIKYADWVVEAMHFSNVKFEFPDLDKLQTNITTFLKMKENLPDAG